jgi:hypothetical protein
MWFGVVTAIFPYRKALFADTQPLTALRDRWIRAKTDPASFGLTDPAQLLDPTHGLSNLLTIGTGARSSGQERIAGEALDEVTTTVPGSSIPVLPDANPAQPVTLVAAINPKTFQVRQISLTGPFTSATSNSTYVVTLTNYNEAVTITLPPA